MGAWIEIFYKDIGLMHINSRTPRWVRGLKYCFEQWSNVIGECRTPRWVRGLKFLNLRNFFKSTVSHPTMGAWIEIRGHVSATTAVSSRTPRWVRGLKYFQKQLHIVLYTVAPHDGCVD